MPVRIYEIAKKLGIESKKVLARARELGITGAKVPSSSLDKITAEYLTNEMGGAAQAAEAEAATSNEAAVGVSESEGSKSETAEVDSSASPATKTSAASKQKTSKGKEKKSPTRSSSSTSKAKTTKEAKEKKETQTKQTKQTQPAKESGSTSRKDRTATKQPTRRQEPAPEEEPETAEPAVAGSAEQEPETVRQEAAPVEESVSPVSEPAAAETEPAQEPVAEPAEAEGEPIPSEGAQEPVSPEEQPAAASKEEEDEGRPTEPQAEPPPEPEEPETDQPRVGEKIGFIELPNQRVQRRDERYGRSAKRQATPARPEKKPSPQQETSRAGDRRPAPPQPPQQRGQEKGKEGAPAQPKAPPKYVAPTSGELITLKQPIIVRDLAEKLGRKPFQLIADLMEMNVFANVNQAIDEETAKQVCAKHNFRFEVEKRERGAGVAKAPSASEVALDEEDETEDLQPRAPVITIMGHVDHGKTTLLDKIRKAHVVDDEEGGMTQHIGAYTIHIPHPERPDELRQLTFLDTPGHEAFSAMRSRGTNVTDIVVLVVAADDGIMPQTVEALKHAEGANVPIIVAVNKTDHPNANPMKVRQQFQGRGIVCEEWGGQTIFQDLSAQTGQGVQELLEMLLLQAEVMELKANPNRRAVGTVVESGKEAGGPVATILVRKGTLHLGDAMLCGQLYGRVRALVDDQGKRQKSAGPSTAVKVLGLNGVPDAGQEVRVVKNEKLAREIAEERVEEARRPAPKPKPKRSKRSLESLFDAMSSDTKALRVVVKADTQGSTEAIVDALKKIDSTKVQVEMVHSGVGNISESDVLVASASKAIIIGFHTRIESGARSVAKREGVTIKQFTIIYQLIDEVKALMAGLLEPEKREVPLGSAEVRQVFSLSKGLKVAGCMVSDGRIAKGRARVLRNRQEVYDGTIQSLRHFQDEVNEVRNGFECGIRLHQFDRFEPGDIIQSYTTEEVPQSL